MADLNQLFSQLLETEGGVEALKAFGERYKAADDEATRILEAQALDPREALDLDIEHRTRTLPIRQAEYEQDIKNTEAINRIGQGRYKSDVGTLTDNTLRILGASFDDKKDARQMNSADYNTYMNKSFDARDKDRALLQRGQTLGLIKNLLGGAAILFS
tara:strand:+ start:259 stop:735 length:477 start_codon:yes stop_codon:yes gene_type:complete